jgi:hypothetical protein
VELCLSRPLLCCCAVHLGGGCCGSGFGAFWNSAWQDAWPRFSVAFVCVTLTYCGVTFRRACWGGLVLGAPALVWGTWGLTGASMRCTRGVARMCIEAAVQQHCRQ